MKMVLLSLMMSLGSTWASNVWAYAGDTGADVSKCNKTAPVNCQILLLSGGEDADGKRFIVKSGSKGCCIKGGGKCCLINASAVSAGGGSGPQVYFVSSGDDRQPVNLTLVGLAEGDGDAKSGWLGVQLSQVSDELQKQLGSTLGVLVTNVVDDSPADDAGFEQYDVIIEVDDRAIGDDIGELVAIVGGSDPDERMKFTVFRNGKRHTVVAILGERASTRLSWAYQRAPDAIFRERIHSSAKILRQNEDGDFVFEVLGDLDDLPNLPHAFLKFLPGAHGKMLEIRVDDDDATVSISVREDGETLSVEREGEGEIVVTRDGDGGETVDRYADEEALAEGDEEAYELYKDASSKVVFGIGGGMVAPHFSFKLDDFDDDGDMDIWLGSIEDQIEGSNFVVQGLMRKLKDLDVHMNFGAIASDGSGPHGFKAFNFAFGKARQTIRENPDGTIDVTVRKGDNELVKRYSDVDDLEARNPDAYEIYLDLTEEDE